MGTRLQVWLEHGAQQGCSNVVTLQLSALPLALMVAFSGWNIVVQDGCQKLKSNNERNGLFLVAFSTNPGSQSEWARLGHVPTLELIADIVGIG